jgi:response regulator RpfG family c-di-GMP phosphodiesterase
MPDRILLVDDEINLLRSLERVLHGDFEIRTAQSGADALALLEREPFSAVLSDMRMPGMDGIAFLSQVKDRFPSVTRAMLTGNADQQVAIDAINQGQIFRFILKPCPPETVKRVLLDCAAQHRLVVAEKELLEKTLRGSIKMLTDLISLANPAVFQRALRAVALVRKIVKHLGLADSWKVEIAAMLSRIGCLSIPEAVLRKYHAALPMEESEKRLMAEHPKTAQNLISNIPRMAPVAEIVGYQNKNFDGSGFPKDALKGKEIPIGARVLRVALDYANLSARGMSVSVAVKMLSSQKGVYDESVVAALAACVHEGGAEKIISVKVSELSDQMTLAADALSINGEVFVGKGAQVSEVLIQRLRHYADKNILVLPLHVLVSPVDAPA